MANFWPILTIWSASASDFGDAGIRHLHRFFKSGNLDSEHHATISCSVTGVRYAYCYAHVHLDGSERSCMIRVTPKHGWQTRKRFTTRQDVGECFAKLIAASFVERLVIEWVQLTDGRLRALQVGFLKLLLGPPPPLTSSGGDAWGNGRLPP